MPVIHSSVMMLGPAGSGRNCFLYGMYDVLSRGIEGFRLCLNDFEDDRRFHQAWQAIRDADFPPPYPPTPHLHQFIFGWGFMPMLEVNWTNWGGGTLLTSKCDLRIQEGLTHLNKADCLVLCVSGEWLRESISGRLMDVLEDTQISRMALFTKDLQSLPTVILITKADLIRHRSRDDIVADVRKLFEPWFDERFILVSPISIIDQMNLDLPFIFAAYAALQKEPANNWLRHKMDHTTLTEKLRHLLIGRLRQAAVFYSGRKVTIDA